MVIVRQDHVKGPDFRALLDLRLPNPLLRCCPGGAKKLGTQGPQRSWGMLAAEVQAIDEELIVRDQPELVTIHPTLVINIDLEDNEVLRESSTANNKTWVVDIIGQVELQSSAFMEDHRLLPGTDAKGITCKDDLNNKQKARYSCSQMAEMASVCVLNSWGINNLTDDESLLPSFMTRFS